MVIAMVYHYAVAIAAATIATVANTAECNMHWVNKKSVGSERWTMNGIAGWFGWESARC